MNTVTASYNHPTLGTLTVTFQSWATNWVSQGCAAHNALTSQNPGAEIDINKISIRVH